MIGNSLSSLFYTMCHCGFIFGSIFSNCNTCTQDSLSQNYLSVNTHILWKRWINTPDVANDSAPFEILSPVSVRHLMFHCFIPQVFFRKPVNQRFHLKANFGCTACRPANFGCTAWAGRSLYNLFPLECSLRVHTEIEFQKQKGQFLFKTFLGKSSPNFAFFHATLH